MELIHQDITKQIIGAAIKVYKTLGYGFLERVYQRAMQVELQTRGLVAEIETKIQGPLQGSDRRGLSSRYLRK